MPDGPRRRPGTFIASLRYPTVPVVPLEFTRFEHARMVGARALQISMGAPPLAAVHGVNAVDIAIDEYEGGLIPMTISRIMYARH